MQSVDCRNQGAGAVCSREERELRQALLHVVLRTDGRGKM
jgi:hypothetical protein